MDLKPSPSFSDLEAHNSRFDRRERFDEPTGDGDLEGAVEHLTPPPLLSTISNIINRGPSAEGFLDVPSGTWEALLGHIQGVVGIVDKFAQVCMPSLSFDGRSQIV